MRSGYVKNYGEKLTEAAVKAEKWNAVIDDVQVVCHGIGLVIGFIGLMYAVAVGCCLLIGAEIGLPCIIGTMSAVGIGALLLVM